MKNIKLLSFALMLLCFSSAFGQCTLLDGPAFHDKVSPLLGSNCAIEFITGNSKTTSTVVSAADSKVKAYAAYSSNTLYIYTAATEFVAPADFSFAFACMSKLTEVRNVAAVNMENVTSMYGMFQRCTNLSKLDLSGMNSANVKTMHNMFYKCTALTSLNLSGMNTANVTDMCHMFDNCSSLQSLDLSSFNTANVRGMADMFSGCSALTSINLSGFSTASALDMEYMFRNCSALTTLDLSSFNTANVKFMSYMFDGCRSLTSLDLSGFNTGNVTGMMQMFGGCTALASIDLGSFNTANMTDMEYMFSGCSALTTLDLSGLSTEKMKYMRNLFAGCSNPKTVYCWNAECPNDVSGQALAGFNSLAASTLYVPKESLAAYQSNETWGSFGNIIGMTLQEFQEVGKADLDAYIDSLTGGAKLSARVMDEVNIRKANIDAATSYRDVRLAVLAAKKDVGGHVHNQEVAGYAMADATHHVAYCSAEGICTGVVKMEHSYAGNSGEGSIHESILCDEDNYTCDVCKYVNETKKAQFDSRDYFCLKAADGDVTLGMSKTGSPDECLLQISADGNKWSEPMTLSETTAEIVTIPSGETRYFRRGSATATDKISTDYAENYWSFTMDGTGTVEAGGNIMSLLDLTCQQTTMDINAFTKLFTGCVQLDKVTVNSQALMNSGNMNYVFGNNVKTYVIGKDVTSIGNSAFSRNSAVTSVTIPEGVTSIGEKAFELCGGLTSIVIPSTVQSIGSNAFARCQKITTFTMNCPSACTFGSNALNGASGYKIIVPPLTTHSWTSNPMWETYGSHFTEPTFTLHANQDPDNAGNWYTTFYNSHYAYDIPEGVKAYKAMIEVGDAETVVKLTAIEGNVLPKGEAVLLYSDVSGDIAMTIIDNNDSNDDDNQFCGVDAQTAQEDYGTYNYYMLSYGQNQLGFYKMGDSMMLSANKAFIVQSPAAPARAMRMVFADDVDGIESISSDSANSPIGIYSVSGVRLNKLQKGINIVNGKKIIVK